MGHFMYTDPGKAIRIDFYAIDADYKATLVQVISTQTECAGSGMLGTFASPKVDQYIALWGDLTNDDFFDTFAVQKLSDMPVQMNTASLSTKREKLKLEFLDLGELYPASNDTVYNCHMYGASHTHPNCLAVLVYHASLSNRQASRIVFHTVIKLPFNLYYSADNVLNGTIPRFSAVIKRMKQKGDGSMVCLVRVMVIVPNSNSEAPASSAVPGESTPQTEAPVSVANAKERATKERYVYLLLHMPHHTVLGIFVPPKYEECTIDVTGERIVRFLATTIVPTTSAVVDDAAKTGGAEAVADANTETRAAVEA